MIFTIFLVFLVLTKKKIFQIFNRYNLFPFEKFFHKILWIHSLAIQKFHKIFLIIHYVFNKSFTIIFWNIFRGIFFLNVCFFYINIISFTTILIILIMINGLIFNLISFKFFIYFLIFHIWIFLLVNLVLNLLIVIISRIIYLI